jgi:beta-mannanase
MPAMTFSCPLTIQGTPLADVAAGLHDSSFLAVARAMVAYNWGGATIRLGWEFNGSWMPWAAGNDPVGYVAAYRHVVTLMRSVPGAFFIFDWCCAWGPAETAPDTVYPGDDVVDIIGMTYYTRYYDPQDADPQYRWNTALTSVYGFNWLVSFSQTHGKPISVSEWGTGVLR